MKRLLNTSLVIVFGVTILSLVNIESALAQRSGRGMSGRSGSYSPSRGSRSFSRPNFPSQGRNSYIPHTGYTYNRSGYRLSPGFSGYRSAYGYRFGRPYYYRPYYSYYHYYRPFLGFRINVLPYGYYPFYFGVNQFYYSGGLFYQQYDHQYEVVVPPVGAEVPSLPDEAKLVTINGNDYYEYKGVYYTQRQNADGKTVYVVAGKDGVLNTPDRAVDVHQVGDIINQLPEGCRAVTIKNEKYYVSPDDVYYEEVIDGNTISYRVIGKIFQDQ